MYDEVNTSVNILDPLSNPDPSTAKDPVTWMVGKVVNSVEPEKTDEPVTIIPSKASRDPGGPCSPGTPCGP